MSCHLETFSAASPIIRFVTQASQPATTVGRFMRLPFLRVGRRVHIMRTNHAPPLPLSSSLSCWSGVPTPYTLDSMGHATPRALGQSNTGPLGIIAVVSSVIQCIGQRYASCVFIRVLTVCDRSSESCVCEEVILPAGNNDAIRGLAFSQLIASPIKYNIHCPDVRKTTIFQSRSRNF